MLLGKLSGFLKSEDPLRAGGVWWGRTMLLQGSQMAKQEHFWQLTTLVSLVLLSGAFVLGTSRRCHHISGPTIYIATKNLLSMQSPQGSLADAHQHPSVARARERLPPQILYPTIPDKPWASKRQNINLLSCCHCCWWLTAKSRQSVMCLHTVCE